MRAAWSRSSSGKWKQQIGTKLWQVLMGTFAIAVLVGSVWVVVGSVWFPEWWYPVIWNGEILDWDYLLTGLSGPPFDEMAFRIATSLGLLVVVLTYLVWARFRNWVYGQAVFIAEVCTAGLIADALLLGKAEVGLPPI